MRFLGRLTNEKMQSITYKIQKYVNPVLGTCLSGHLLQFRIIFPQSFGPSNIRNLNIKFWLEHFDQHSKEVPITQTELAHPSPCTPNSTQKYVWKKALSSGGESVRNEPSLVLLLLNLYPSLDLLTKNSSIFFYFTANLPILEDLDGKLYAAVRGGEGNEKYCVRRKIF